MKMKDVVKYILISAAALSAIAAAVVFFKRLAEQLAPAVDECDGEAIFIG